LNVYSFDILLVSPTPKRLLNLYLKSRFTKRKTLSLFTVYTKFIRVYSTYKKFI
jgi:hypothetical protein